jgi:hypothetical protein
MNLEMLEANLSFLVSEFVDDEVMAYLKPLAELTIKAE